MPPQLQASSPPCMEPPLAPRQGSHACSPGTLNHLFSSLSEAALLCMLAKQRLCHADNVAHPCRTLSSTLPFLSCSRGPYMPAGHIHSAVGGASHDAHAVGQGGRQYGAQPGQHQHGRGRGGPQLWAELCLLPGEPHQGIRQRCEHCPAWSLTSTQGGLSMLCSGNGSVSPCSSVYDAHAWSVS